MFSAKRHSYSGRSLQTLAGCGQSGWKKIPLPVSGIKHAHAPYCYRCPFGAKDSSNCSLECANDIEELILTETGGEIAAFMAETVIGSGGFIVPPKGYFEVATSIARKYGGRFIECDVQRGLAMPQGIVVHARQIIVDQGIDVDRLHRRAGANCR